MDGFAVPLEIGDHEGRSFKVVKAMDDSGATYTAVLGSVIDRLGMCAHTSRGFALADGSRVDRRLGKTRVRLEGHEEISPVVFREAGTQPLLGTVTLEIFSLGIDPVNQRLMPVDALMLGFRDRFAAPGSALL